MKMQEISISEQKLMLPGFQPTELSLKELTELRDCMQNVAAQAKDYATLISDEISLRVGDRLRAARAAAQKPHGVIEFDHDGLYFKASCSKRVEYDQNKLAEFGELLAERGQNPRDYLDIKLGISEKRYAALDSRLRVLVDNARTVKVGPETIEVTSKQG